MMISGNEYNPPVKSIGEDDVTLLIDGTETYPKILELIEKSVKSVYVESYTWRDDDIGNKVAQAVLDAANRGVKIKIRKDKIGEVHEKAEDFKQSFFHKDFSLKLYALEKFYNYWWYPKISDHSVSSYPQKKNEIRDALLSHKNVDAIIDQNHKDHSKVWIIDEEKVMCGGINVEDKALTVDVKGRHWMDFMILFEGKKYVDMFKSRQAGKSGYNDKSVLNFIFNKDHAFEMKYHIMNNLDRVSKSAVLMNPYWSDPDLFNKIIEMTEKGIKITLILPGDSNCLQHLNMKKIKNLYKQCQNLNNLDIYLTNDFLHGKAMYLDDRFVWIGSGNFNVFAMRKVRETCAFLDGNHSEKVKKKLETRIQYFKDHSKKVESVKDFLYSPFFAFMESFPEKMTTKAQ